MTFIKLLANFIFTSFITFINIISKIEGVKILQVQIVDNQPNFGIKYVNKNIWNSKVLETFENSKLLKEINAKYPNAQALYYNKTIKDRGMFSSKNIYTTFFDIILEPYKKFRWSLASYKDYIPDKLLIDELQILSLKRVEKESVREFLPLEIANTNKVQKPNIFKRLINKFFTNKS